MPTHRTSPHGVHAEHERRALLAQHFLRHRMTRCWLSRVRY